MDGSLVYHPNAATRLADPTNRRAERAVRPFVTQLQSSSG
jgi:hypothetical protein